MMGSSRACCLVGSEITLLREFRISISFKLCTLGFKRSSFMSPTIITLFVISKDFSVFLFKESKKFAPILMIGIRSVLESIPKC